MESSNFKIFSRTIIKGAISSTIITIVSLIIFSMLLINTNLNENFIQPVIIGTTGISVLMGSFIFTKKMKKNGAFIGCLIGLLYIFTLNLISYLINDLNFEMNLRTVIMICIGIIGGSIGGIMGVNT